MIDFENKYFRKIDFEHSQIRQYFEAAAKDLAIARSTNIPEVIFKFSYDALIKLGIALIAKSGYKVRSVSGHHVKILEKMSQLLKDEEIDDVGNQMRQKRNLDFYNGGVLITQKDSQEYLEFVEDIFRKLGISPNTLFNYKGFKTRK